MTSHMTGRTTLLTLLLLGLLRVTRSQDGASLLLLSGPDPGGSGAHRRGANQGGSGLEKDPGGLGPLLESVGSKALLSHGPTGLRGPLPRGGVRGFHSGGLRGPLAGGGGSRDSEGPLCKMKLLCSDPMP